jgi:hypothetical protein
MVVVPSPWIGQGKSGASGSIRSVWALSILLSQVGISPILLHMASMEVGLELELEIGVEVVGM